MYNGDNSYAYLSIEHARVIHCDLLISCIVVYTGIYRSCLTPAWLLSTTEYRQSRWWR